jgi:hypothetical protein
MGICEFSAECAADFSSGDMVRVLRWNVGGRDRDW